MNKINPVTSTVPTFQLSCGITAILNCTPSSPPQSVIIPMHRYCVSLRYNGLTFLGCSPQPTDLTGGLKSALPTVPSPVRSIHWHLTTSLNKLMDSSWRGVQFSSRTDRFVSAMRNTVQVDVSESFDPRRLIDGWNWHLSDTTDGLRVMEAIVVPCDWNARRSAIERTYEYTVTYPGDSSPSGVGLDPLPEGGQVMRWGKKLDVGRMRIAGGMMVGSWDGRWCRGKKCDAVSFYTTVGRVEVEEVGGVGVGGYGGWDGGGGGGVWV